jgi:hypothetical protein
MKKRNAKYWSLLPATMAGHGFIRAGEKYTPDEPQSCLGRRKVSAEKGISYQLVLSRF